jgi:uncharacterized glyoxalase superfamily protein PhnB
MPSTLRTRCDKNVGIGPIATMEGRRATREVPMPTTINPVVHYRDLEAGMRFLVDTFGFAELAVHRSDDGTIQYAELALDGAPLGLGPSVEDSMFDTGPAVVYISFDDVDGMHDRAAKAGAEILMPPTDQDYGSRDFVAKDHEGNVWCFGTFQPGTS